MKIHANARTCAKSRRLLVRRVLEEGWSLMEAAEEPASSGRPDVDGRPREPLRGPERGRGDQVATGRCNGLQQACAGRDEAASAKAGDPAFSSNSDSPLRETGYAGSTATNLESVSNYESFISRPGAHAHQTALSDDDPSRRNCGRRFR